MPIPSSPSSPSSTLSVVVEYHCYSNHFIWMKTFILAVRWSRRPLEICMRMVFFLFLFLFFTFLFSYSYIFIISTKVNIIHLSIRRHREGEREKSKIIKKNEMKMVYFGSRLRFISSPFTYLRTHINITWPGPLMWLFNSYHS